mgnify:CR=1 FL=1
MGQPAFQLYVSYEAMVCGECGISFAAPESFWSNRRDDHKTWYCPNGHSRHYPGESEKEKAQRLLREEQARHQRTISRENEERAAREKAERKLKRVGRGVCPDCNRTFQNLARHMTCKHKGKP